MATAVTPLLPPHGTTGRHCFKSPYSTRALSGPFSLNLCAIYRFNGISGIRWETSWGQTYLITNHHDLLFSRIIENYRGHVEYILFQERLRSEITFKFTISSTIAEINSKKLLRGFIRYIYQILFSQNPNLSLN